MRLVTFPPPPNKNKGGLSSVLLHNSILILAATYWAIIGVDGAELQKGLAAGLEHIVEESNGAAGNEEPRGKDVATALSQLFESTGAYGTALMSLFKAIQQRAIYPPAFAIKSKVTMLLPFAPNYEGPKLN